MSLERSRIFLDDLKDDLIGDCFLILACLIYYTLKTCEGKECIRQCSASVQDCLVICEAAL